jgi:spore coat protein U-like protein
MTKRTRKTFLSAFILILFVAAAVGFWILPEKVLAGSPATAQFQVEAYVINDCNISTPANINFGNYDPTSPTALTGQTTTTITCTKGDSNIISIYLVGTNDGLSPAGAWAMANAGNYLGYNLYEDSGLTTPFPTTAPATSNLPTCGTSPCYNYPGGSVVTTIYGQVPAGQNVPSSGTAYSDTVTIKVTY